MNIKCKVSRYEFWYDETTKKSDWWMPYYECVGRAVRLSSNSGQPYLPNSTEFRLYPLVAEQDFEGDTCHIAVFDILNPKIDAIWYPRLIVMGYVGEMAVSQEVADDLDLPGSRKYTPDKDKNWTPGMIKLVLEPVE